MDRKPLFPGKSCFPLSPAKDETEERNGFPFSTNDQLAVIFNVIGTPTDEDVSFVTDQQGMDYLKSFPQVARTDLQAKYPGAPKEAIDFLDKILVFNPFFRMSLDDALSHPFFAKLYNPDDINHSTEIKLDFEKMKLDTKSLRKLFVAEIKKSAF